MEKPLDHGRLVLVMLSICTASLLAGCFGSKTYPNSLDKNLRVHTATDSGSWFSRVRAAVDIHRVGEDCTLDYEGTVQLADPKIDIGIPSHRWSYLVFVFANSSFFANRSDTITYETLVKPRAGSHYEVAASFSRSDREVLTLGQWRSIFSFPLRRSFNAFIAFVSFKFALTVLADLRLVLLFVLTGNFILLTDGIIETSCQLFLSRLETFQARALCIDMSDKRQGGHHCEGEDYFHPTTPVKADEYRVIRDRTSATGYDSVGKVSTGGAWNYSYVEEWNVARDVKRGLLVRN